LIQKIFGFNFIKMGKVILEFDSSEEQEEIQNALDGYKWKLAMWDLDQELRKTTKYGTTIIKEDINETADVVEIAVADKIRDTIREVLEKYNLKLD